MAASEGSKGLPCACGKSFIWFTVDGIEFACRQCKRKVIVPWENLRGPEPLLRFITDWRRAQRPRRIQR
jgi:hypothetical protein